MSGGADSIALLLGLSALVPALGYRLQAAHLHHGLRGAEADRDLEAVRALCRRLGVPLTAARWDCRSRMARLGLSGQAGLRTLRRRFLARAARSAGAAAIATAHTADDQMETVLLRLVRGTGLRGLAGMSVRRGGWLKPLLAVTRAEIEADLRAAGEPWREDRSNEDPAYERNRIRSEVIPALLAPADPGRAGAARAALARRFAAACDEVRSARRVVEAQATRILERTAGSSDGRITLDPRRLGSYPLAIQRAVLRQLWRRSGHRTGLTLRHLGALQSLIVARGGRSAVDLPRGWRAERDRGLLVLGPAAGAPDPAPARVPGRGRWRRSPIRGGWVDGAAARSRLRARVGGEEYFAADGIEGALELRAGRPEEWFVPFGDRKPRRLSAFLSKQRVPRALGARPMVLADAQGILWVVGVRRAARAPLIETTRRALWVQTENR